MWGQAGPPTHPQNLHGTQVQLHHPWGYFTADDHLLTWEIGCGYGTLRFSARWIGSRGIQVLSTMEIFTVAVAW